MAQRSQKKTTTNPIGAYLAFSKLSVLALPGKYFQTGSIFFPVLFIILVISELFLGGVGVILGDTWPNGPDGSKPRPDNAVLGAVGSLLRCCSRTACQTVLSRATVLGTCMATVPGFLLEVKALDIPL